MRIFPSEIVLVGYLLVRLNRMLSMWPTHLRLEIFAIGVHTLAMQAWILEHRAPVVRIQCAPDTDDHDFGELIKSLREHQSVRRSGLSPRLSLTDWQVAIVRWETREEGSKRGLVLAPLHGALLCAAFLTSDIPKLPTAPLQQPQARQDEQQFLLQFQPALIDGLVPAVAG